MNINEADNLKPCALCGANRKLEVSHIIPQFVYRSQRETVAKDGRQGGPGIDRWARDEPKHPMLCGCCEDSFSIYESEFARLVFHPLIAGGTVSVKYGGWLRKFSASVCWRILEDMILENRLIGSHERWTSSLDTCRDTWRHYLLGERPDVGEHHVHLLQWRDIMGEEGARFLGKPVGITDGPVRNRDRMIQSEVHSGGSEVFVYAKLGPVILFGLINDSDPKQWKGTRINAEGKLKPRDILIPDSYRNYIFARLADTAS